MKIKTILAAAILLCCAGAARADNVQTAYGWYTIPDGATVTGLSQSAGTSDVGPAYTVDFSFADGTGSSSYNWYFGQWGEILFSTPVSDLSFDWIGSQGQCFSVGDNAGDGFEDCSDSGGTADFAGTDITEISWSDMIAGGIASLSYTEDSDPPADPPASAPELGTFSMLACGLAVLAAMRSRYPIERAMDKRKAG
jgi:hypothetical protein